MPGYLDEVQFTLKSKANNNEAKVLDRFDIV